MVAPLRARLDYLEAELKQSPPGFLLTADLPFAVFRYDPRLEAERELTLRREIQNLAVRVQNATGRSVHFISLAELLWKAIEEAEGIAALVEQERDWGFEDAQRQVGRYLSDPQFASLPDRVAAVLEPLHPERDLAFLVRATALGPRLYPVSILLEQLLGRVRVPGVLFYPGTWTGGLNYLGLRAEEDQAGSYRVKIYGAE